MNNAREQTLVTLGDGSQVLIERWATGLTSVDVRAHVDDGWMPLEMRGGHFAVIHVDHVEV